MEAKLLKVSVVFTGFHPKTCFEERHSLKRKTKYENKT